MTPGEELQRAAELLRTGQIPAGKQLVEALIARYPKFADPWIFLATLAADEGDQGSALELSRHAVSVDPANLNARILFGNRLQEAGRYGEASDQFRAVIERDPENTSAYFGLTKGKRIGDDDRPLLQQMRRLLKRDLPVTGRALLCYGLGKAYDDLSEFGQAIEFFDEANKALFGLAAPFSQAQYRATVDLTVRKCTAETLLPLKDVGIDSELPVFIVGMARSGTSLVEQILSSHPAVAGGGESPYWLTTGKSVMSGLVSNRLDRPLTRRISESYVGQLNAFGAGRARVTDKMPANYEVLGAIHLCLPNARMIYCKRRPVDNCLSVYTTPFVRGAPPYAHNRDNIAFTYRQHLRVMEQWNRVIPVNRLMEVDYEQLVENPEPLIREMVEFIGLPWDNACLEHYRNDRVVQTPSTWQVRQPIYRTSVDRWRNYRPWLREFEGLLDLE